MMKTVAVDRSGPPQGPPRCTTTLQRIVFLPLLLFLCLVVTATRAEFERYADNGGTVVGISGRDWVVLASDTRLSDGYVIKSRNVSKLLELSPGTYLAASGCWSDTAALAKVLQHHLRLYAWQNERPVPSVTVLAHLLSSVLYSRRHFPYYALCAVAGLDEHGCGALYRFDAVGSCERVQAVCAGKGEQLIQPMLDVVTRMEEEATDVDARMFEEDGDAAAAAVVKHDLDVDGACALVVRAFQAAAEREITVGDGVDLCIIRRADTAATAATEGDGGGGGVAARGSAGQGGAGGGRRWLLHQQLRRKHAGQRVAFTVERRSAALPRH